MITIPVIQQWRIYELVCRRFMATLASDAITENLAVKIDLNGELFIANGQRYLEKGWKLFYPYSKATELILPPLEKIKDHLFRRFFMKLKE